MNSCLACGSENIRVIVDFGLQAAANILSSVPNEIVRREKLALCYCENCGHAQQHSFYPVDELFSHYLYQSGTSKTLGSYFKWLAHGVRDGGTIPGRALEIASNDGSFLSELKAIGVDAEGVDPAANLAKIANERGLKTTVGFWPDSVVPGQFSSIIAQNVIAHTPNPLAFMTGIYKALHHSGVAYIQASQVDMFLNYEFDTLYHEHFSFYCPNSMMALAKRSGFSFGSFIKTDIHGGSLLGLFSDNLDSLNSAVSALSKGPYFISELQSYIRPSEQQAEAFSSRAEGVCRTLRSVVDRARKTDHEIVLVGAAAKAITVLQASGVHADLVVDEAPLKRGLYIPGTEMRIDDLNAISEIDRKVFFIFGAWNFYDELKLKVKNLRNKKFEDRFFRYFPELVTEE